MNIQLLRALGGLGGGGGIEMSELFAFYDGTIFDNYLIDKSGVRDDVPEPGRCIIPGASSTTYFTHPDIKLESVLFFAKDKVVMPSYIFADGRLTLTNTTALCHFIIYYEGIVWGEYPLCESSGTIIHDVSGNGRHLSLTIGTGSWGTQTLVRNYVNEFGYNLNGNIRIPALNSTIDALGNPLVYKGKIRRNALLLDSSFNEVASVEAATYINFNPSNIVEEGFDYMNRTNTTYFVSGLTIYNSNNFIWAKTEVFNIFVKTKLHAFNFNKIFAEGLSKIAISKEEFSDKNIAYLKYDSEKSRFGQLLKNIYHYFDNDISTISDSFEWKHKIWPGISAKNTNASTKPIFVNNEVSFNSNKYAVLDNAYNLNNYSTYIFQGKFPNNEKILIGSFTPGQSYILKSASSLSVVIAGTTAIVVPISINNDEHIVVVTIAASGVWVYVDGVLTVKRKPETSALKTTYYKGIGASDNGAYPFGGTFKKIITFTSAILNSETLSSLTNTLFNQQITYSKAVNIHYSGDSITFDSGNTTRYADLIMNSIPKSCYVMNALGGATTLQILWGMGYNFQTAYIPDCDNNIFVEFLGANDISVNSPPEKIYAAKKAHCLIAKSKGYKTVCVGVLPRTFPQGSGNEHLDSWNGVNALLRADHSFCDAFVDVQLDPIMGVAGSQYNETYYLDETHPTIAGQAELQRLIQPAIESLIL